MSKKLYRVKLRGMTSTLFNTQGVPLLLDLGQEDVKDSEVS